MATNPTAHQSGPLQHITRGRPRGSMVGAKRGRRPRGTLPGPTDFSTRPVPFEATSSGPSTSTSTNAPTSVHWPGATFNTSQPRPAAEQSGQTFVPPIVVQRSAGLGISGLAAPAPGTSLAVQSSAAVGMSVLSLPGVVVPPATARPFGAPGEEEDDGENELLPAMADDDYTAQLSWQSQSKDNLK
jgi:transcription initiation factor TFIID subunit 11